MSHFAVLVITDQKPTKTVLDKALAPFHEFESTGVVNEYVQSVDQLQEAREEYASRKERRFEADVELNGDDVRAFREFVEYYYDRHLLAEGEAPDLEGEHKWGWYRINDEGEVSELIVRTNPNMKWDWWVVGGRWSGFLTPKAEAAARDPSDPDAPAKGRPGLMGSEANPAGVDVIRKGDVDFEAMRTTVLFAVLKDGQWVERGQMGWWDSDFNAMLDALPEDAWLTVVDCHI